MSSDEHAHDDELHRTISHKYSHRILREPTYQLGGFNPQQHAGNHIDHPPTGHLICRHTVRVQHRDGSHRELANTLRELVGVCQGGTPSGSTIHERGFAIKNGVDICTYKVLYRAY